MHCSQFGLRRPDSFSSFDFASASYHNPFPMETNFGFPYTGPKLAPRQHFGQFSLTGHGRGRDLEGTQL